MSHGNGGASSHGWSSNLSALLAELADDVSQAPQREYSAPAWARAGKLRRRRTVLGAVAALVLVAVPAALLIPRSGNEVPPGGPGVTSPAQPAFTDAPRSRAAHTATLLNDGRVLIVGGCATDGCTSAAEDPVTEYYVPGRGFTPGPEMVQPRQGHSATPLTDGRVLIVGGWAGEGTPALDSAEVYEPQTGQFRSVGPLAVRRGGHIATALPDGRVLIAGGDTDTAELFDPERDEFIAAASMPEPRFAAGSITLADGRVLVVGGRDSSGRAVATAILYDPKSDSWQPTGSMSTPRDKHELAPLPGGRVLVMGGTPDDRELLASTEIYDPETGAFEPGPSMDIRRYKLTAAVDAEGRVIVVGGTQVAVFDSDGFHPVDGTAGPVRWVPSVTTLPNGDVLIIGGYDESIRLHADAQLISADRIAAATQ